jgi:hypothetical protein
MGMKARQQYRSDRMTLARCCRGWLVLARNRAASRAPRRGHRYVGNNPLALMRRSGPQMAAYRVVTIGENVAPKDSPAEERGSM